MNIDRTLRERWYREDERWVAELPDGWLQGRTVYGGLGAAFAVALAQKHIAPARRLRNFSCQLVRPISPGRVEGVFRVVREGKSLTFVTVELHQGALAAQYQFAYASPREGSVVVEAGVRYRPEDPESMMALPYIEGVTPEFTKHVQLHWDEGTPPFCGAPTAEFRGAFRFRDPAGDEEGLLGLLDAWPPPSLSILDRPAFASTATWSGHLIAVPERLDEWFGFHYRTEVGRDGFHTTVGRMFDPSGALIATSEQLVAMFD